MSGAQDLADVLAQAGAVVAGGAALGATSFFIGASIAHDLGFRLDPLRAAERGAQIGGSPGFVALMLRLGDVH